MRDLLQREIRAETKFLSLSRGRKRKRVRVRVRERERERQRESERERERERTEWGINNALRYGSFTLSQGVKISKKR